MLHSFKHRFCHRSQLSGLRHFEFATGSDSRVKLFSVENFVGTEKGRALTRTLLMPILTIRATNWQYLDRSRLHFNRNDEQLRNYTCTLWSH